MSSIDMFSLTTTARSVQPGSDQDPDFTAFWRLYPRKDGKGAARRSWCAALRIVTADTILAGLAAYRFDPSPRFRPLPSTWLNGERWIVEDDGFDPVLRAAGLSQEDFRDE